MKEIGNHAGDDVEFIADGDVIGEVQCKAGGSEAGLLECVARYPEIKIMVTEEITGIMPGIESQSFLNEKLRRVSIITWNSSKARAGFGLDRASAAGPVRG